MGILENQIQKIRKMKLFALIACVSAGSHAEWLVEQWWTEAVNVFTFANDNWSKFTQAVNTIPDSTFRDLYYFCEPAGPGAELTSTEFASKYWNFIDQDGSGGLNFNEFKYTFAGSAAVDSRVIMKAFDADNNGLLDSSELTAWRAYVREIVTAWGWSLSDGQISELEQAWKNAQDTDENSASMIEIARFLLSSYNIFL